MELMFAAVLAAVVGVAVGWALGVSSGAKRFQRALDQVADPSKPLSAPMVMDVRRRIEAGWVPKGEERSEAATEAIARMQAFLRGSIEAPLNEGLSGDTQALRHGAERAISALQDLNFFADRAVGERSVAECGPLIREVVDEFKRDWKADVGVVVPDQPIQVRADREGLLDSLYLILHNAIRFSSKKPVTVTLEDTGTYAKVSISDQGPGFSAEALSRAYDPFYSTSPDGLGLGLPHARKVIEMMSGEIHIRNGDEGGVVEVSIPLA